MQAAWSDEALDGFERRIDGWLQQRLAIDDAMLAVDRGEAGERRWYVRLAGEAKDFTTVWLTLGQRTLRYETYVMPAPEENEAEFYRHLLERNWKLVGATFAIGGEGAVFLKGELPLAAYGDEELDRIIGSMLAFVEQCFRPALRLGFASRFADS